MSATAGSTAEEGRAPDESSDAVATDYRVFGGVLRSELAFPELRPAPDGGSVSWTLRVRRGAAPAPAGAALGEDFIEPVGPRITVWPLREGLRVEYSDTGAFDLTDAGRRIVWHAPDSAPVELARMDVIGRVLAVALQLEGHVCLHASAVATPAGVIAFLAPKFFGKSTLALALTYGGARLVTDDTLAVLPSDPPVCLPGVHSVRLREESAAHLARQDADGPRAGDRHVVNWLPDASLLHEPAPLAALYLLEPAGAEAAEAAAREPLPPMRGAMAIVQHIKTGSMWRGAAAGELFHRAATISGAVPVFALRVARDLARIDEAAGDILAWHR